MTRKAQIPAGTRNGRLEILEYVTTDDPRHPMYRCRCDCGNETLVQRANLARTHSCGCLKREITGAKNRTHAMSNSPEYHVWADIQQRCSRITRPGWPNYGGRGIRVCQHWIDSFENFYADMGPRPTPQHTIDRVDNNGNYEKSNCRWATRLEQGNNRRNTPTLIIHGHTGTLSQLCRHFDVRYSVVYQRINTMGWSPERALTTPVLQRSKKS